MTNLEPLRILVLGANYGLLAAVKISLAGHHVTLVCRRAEADTFLAQGAQVLIPSKDLADRRALTLPTIAGATHDGGILGVVEPTDAQPDQFDLAILAMGEPQFAAPEIANLMAKIGQTSLPCLSLMNLLPAAFLAGLGLDTAKLAPAYGAFDIWKTLSPSQITSASPDPQAVRLDPARPNDLTVTLASNFKVAPFVDAAPQSLIARLAHDVDHIAGAATAVRIVAHPSRFVPLAKWPMLITGNCRCLRDGAPISIGEAVHSDLVESRQIYDWVTNIVRMIGASDADLVPFDRYAAAAKSLSLPSSLARALHAKAQKIERVDLLVQLVSQDLGHRSGMLNKIVDKIEAALARNRA
jgi:hypothetical protein